MGSGRPRSLTTNADSQRAIFFDLRRTPSHPCRSGNPLLENLVVFFEAPARRRRWQHGRRRSTFLLSPTLRTVAASEKRTWGVTPILPLGSNCPMHEFPSSPT